MSDEQHQQRREFGRDGVSGMVDRERALRAKLLPRRERGRDDAGAPRPGDVSGSRTP